MDARHYKVIEQLRDGSLVEIRALRPDDRADMLTAVAGISAPSMYRRFFGVKRDFSETEIAFYLDVDFVNHVALVATVGEADRPVIAGGGRFVVVQQDAAEVAFAVIDKYQSKGICSALLRHLTLLAQGAGLKALVAEVLPENAAMLRVFEKSGYDIVKKRDRGVVHIRLRLS